MAADKKAVVKKVRAFPINAQLKIGASAIKASIVRLNTRGVLAEVAVSDLLPGEKCEMAFEIPVLHFAINEQMVVVKQYSQWQGGKHAQVQMQAQAQAPAAQQPSTNPKPGVAHLVEAHFTALSETGRERIVAFLKAVGAVDP